MKSLRIVLIALVVILISIQFITSPLNKSDYLPDSDFSKIYSVPGDVQMILKTSCFDCHSNNTRYPWYSKIQPFGWLLASHIRDGKEDLNFNEFGNYSARRKKSKLKSIGNVLKDGTMPLKSYLLLHPDARLSKLEENKINAWLEILKDSLNRNE
ncbi:MAG: heme-binding domain-containing protein [Daejeonella sp.]